MQIRRTLTFFDEVAIEAGQQVSPPLRKVAVAAIIQNPFAGRFERDLSPLTQASVEIGRHVCRLAISMLSPHKAESYGKAAIIGVDGEQEHGVAMLTTVFGNVMREEAGGGKAWISSITKRAAPGATIDIPLAHKDALYVRSHYDGITVTLPDAPQPDGIVIICAYANRGRPNHRVGGLAVNQIKGVDGRPEPSRRRHKDKRSPHDNLQDRRGARQVSQGRPYHLHRRETGARRYRAPGLSALGELGRNAL
jgi:hypothetical protein